MKVIIIFNNNISKYYLAGFHQAIYIKSCNSQNHLVKLELMSMLLISLRLRLRLAPECIETATLLMTDTLQYPKPECARILANSRHLIFIY